MNLSPVPSAVPSLSFTKRRIQRNVRKESYRLDKRAVQEEPFRSLWQRKGCAGKMQ